VCKNHNFPSNCETLKPEAPKISSYFAIVASPAQAFILSVYIPPIAT